MRCNCSGDNGPPKSSFNPSSVVAALPLPPPNPAASGMCFSSSSRTPSLTPAASRNTAAARYNQVARVGRQTGRIAA